MFLAGLIVSLIQSYCLYMICKNKAHWWFVVFSVMSICIGVTLMLISVAYFVTRAY